MDGLLYGDTLDSQSTQAVGQGAVHLEDRDKLTDDITGVPAGASILVKGSRFMQMERVVSHLTGQNAGGQ